MLRLIPYLSALILLSACQKEEPPIIVHTNNVGLTISAPYNNETFEQNYAVSVDGIIRAEEFIDGYEVILVHEGTKDTLDYYFEEGPFNYFTVHHHWTNDLDQTARVNITVNALNAGEAVASTQLSVNCKD